MQKNVVDGSIAHHIDQQEIRNKGVGFIRLLSLIFGPCVVAIIVTIGASYMIAHLWANQSTLIVWGALNWGVIVTVALVLIEYVLLLAIIAAKSMDEQVPL